MYLAFLKKAFLFAGPFLAFCLWPSVAVPSVLEAECVPAILHEASMLSVVGVDEVESFGFEEEATLPGRLSRSEERALALRIANHEEEAKVELVTRNLPYVKFIAKKFAARATALRVELDDLIQEGSRAMWKAADSFDPKYGTKFITWAHRPVEQAMRRLLNEKARRIRLPGEMERRLTTAAYAEMAFIDSHGHLPSEEELADELGLKGRSRDNFISARASARPSLSLSVETSPEVADASGHISSALAEMSEDWQLFQAALRRLPKNEARLIKLLLGLDSESSTPLTLNQAAAQLGLSRADAKALLQKAVTRLREFIENPVHPWASPANWLDGFLVYFPRRTEQRFWQAVGKLEPREHAILGWRFEGVSDATIGARLDLSEETIDKLAVHAFIDVCYQLKRKSPRALPQIAAAEIANYPKASPEALLNLLGTFPEKVVRAWQLAKEGFAPETIAFIFSLDFETVESNLASVQQKLREALSDPVDNLLRAHPGATGAELWRHINEAPDSRQTILTLYLEKKPISVIADQSGLTVEEAALAIEDEITRLHWLLSEGKTKGANRDLLSSLQNEFKGVSLEQLDRAIRATSNLRGRILQMYWDDVSLRDIESITGLTEARIKRLYNAGYRVLQTRLTTLSGSRPPHSQDLINQLAEQHPYRTRADIEAAVALLSTPQQEVLRRLSNAEDLDYIAEQMRQTRLWVMWTRNRAGEILLRKLNRINTLAPDADAYINARFGKSQNTVDRFWASICRLPLTRANLFHVLFAEKSYFAAARKFHVPEKTFTRELQRAAEIVRSKMEGQAPPAQLPDEEGREREPESWLNFHLLKLYPKASIENLHELVEAVEYPEHKAVLRGYLKGLPLLKIKEQLGWSSIWRVQAVILIEIERVHRGLHAINGGDHPSELAFKLRRDYRHLSYSQIENAIRACGGLSGRMLQLAWDGASLHEIRATLGMKADEARDLYNRAVVFIRGRLDTIEQELKTAPKDLVAALKTAYPYREEAEIKAVLDGLDVDVKRALERVKTGEDIDEYAVKIGVTRDWLNKKEQFGNLMLQAKLATVLVPDASAYINERFLRSSSQGYSEDDFWRAVYQLPLARAHTLHAIFAGGSYLAGAKLLSSDEKAFARSLGHATELVRAKLGSPVDAASFDHPLRTKDTQLWLKMTFFALYPGTTERELFAIAEKSSYPGYGMALSLYLRGLALEKISHQVGWASLWKVRAALLVEIDRLHVVLGKEGRCRIGNPEMAIALMNEFRTLSLDQIDAVVQSSGGTHGLFLKEVWNGKSVAEIANGRTEKAVQTAVRNQFNRTRERLKDLAEESNSPPRDFDAELRAAHPYRTPEEVRKARAKLKALQTDVLRRREKGESIPSIAASLKVEHSVAAQAEQNAMMILNASLRTVLVPDPAAFIEERFLKPYDGRRSQQDFWNVLDTIPADRARVLRVIFEKGSYVAAMRDLGLKERPFNNLIKLAFAEVRNRLKAMDDTTEAMIE